MQYTTAVVGSSRRCQRQSVQETDARTTGMFHCVFGPELVVCVQFL